MSETLFGGAMTATVGWPDILLRLGAALLAGALIGMDRGTRGRIAGLRTTILMCLAATGAMIEANLVLGVLGKTDSSFAMMDALRFPLGILSGIGLSAPAPSCGGAIWSPASPPPPPCG